MACTVIRHVHRTTGAADPIASETSASAPGPAPHLWRRTLDASRVACHSRRSVRSSAASTAAARTASATPRSSCSVMPQRCGEPSSLPSTSPTSSTKLEDRFAGLAAADVLVSSLEHLLLPELRFLSRSAVLLNSGGRVIASSSPHFTSGMRMPAPAARGSVPTPGGAGRGQPKGGDRPSIGNYFRSPGSS